MRPTGDRDQGYLRNSSSTRRPAHSPQSRTFPAGDVSVQVLPDARHVPNTLPGMPGRETLQLVLASWTRRLARIPRSFALVLRKVRSRAFYRHSRLTSARERVRGVVGFQTTPKRKPCGTA